MIPERVSYPEINISNATLVLKDQIVRGSLSIRDGWIAAIDDGALSRAPHHDMQGDYLLPGLVELHTDNLEGHLVPRPKVAWPPLPAVQAHDAEITAAGITTVFDSLRVGDEHEDDHCKRLLQASLEGIESAERAGALRADHHIHLRCEVGCAYVVEDAEAAMEEPRVSLVSLMDHTPGQRQFANLDAYRIYYQGKMNMSDEEIDRFIARKIEENTPHVDGNRRRIAALGREKGLILASHDDATAAHVEEAVELGVTLAEFPTTVQAAEAAHRSGLSNLAGAPNLVRGKSHSGNVAARELADRGLLHGIASDYVPSSSLLGLLKLHDEAGWSLPDAVATATLAPARMAGLDDRGEIAPGLRADLVQISRHGSGVAVRSVWRLGERVL